jgi:zinc transport system ATP-binding protein
LTAKTPAVLIKDLSYSYDGPKVLKDVSLEIPEGGLVSVVGRNGGGKSTLLKLILGLLEPQEGQLQVFGQAPHKVGHLMGYVPQRLDFDPTFPVTVMDVVLMGRLSRSRLFGWYRRSDRAAAHQALERVELTDLVERPFHALSGGQRQRVLVARALASQPRLLLMDEATSNVDLPSQTELYLLMRELAGEHTVITVTHDMNFISTGVERVICINRKAAIHPTAEVSDDRLCEAYGGQVRQVLHDHDNENGEAGS